MDDNNNLPKHIKWTIFIFKMISVILGIWFAYDIYMEFFNKN